VTEVWFYHLEHRVLEDVLPTLLERSLQRGWRVVVQAGSPERVATLDQLLWTFRDDSFLPHGTLGDGDPGSQPILLVDGPEAPNAPSVRFMLDGAKAAPLLAEAIPAYERVVLLFDGRDDEAVAGARAQWVELKRAGHAVSYWQQDEDGRWEKRA
jgi:DNA polymerase-3 subunit chi